MKAMFPGTNVFISERAYADIINETLQNIYTETGGILLGAKGDHAWYVVESLDPGPRAILRSTYFEYDHKYLTHLANKVGLRYRTKLQLLGPWHRHPGSLDQFSSIDDETNRTFVRTCGGVAISGLVNIDPKFRMTFYIATGDPVQYERAAVSVGDQHIPDEFLNVWDSRSLLYLLANLTTEVPISEIENRPDGEILTTAESDRERHNTLLDILDPELEYLQQQQEYSYELSLEDNTVRFLLRKAIHLRECPPRLEFLFIMVDDSISVYWDGQTYPFKPGITKMLVNKAFKVSI